MRNRITQREAIFYQLYTQFKQKDGKYIPVFQLMGEVWCPEVSKWGFVSYECSARASEMIKKNPQLIQRQSIRGKSGATYYGYRINPSVTVEMIQDPDLRTFHRIIKNRMEAQKV